MGTCVAAVRLPACGVCVWRYGPGIWRGRWSLYEHRGGAVTDRMEREGEGRVAGRGGEGTGIC